VKLEREERESMGKFTRRSLFTRASAGALAVGGVIAVPHLLGVTEKPAEASAERPAAMRAARADLARTTQDPIVAHLRDRDRGELALFVGTREVVIRNPELAARLIEAAG
jgi:hypothetical protein